jgi:hypothetical protein
MKINSIVTSEYNKCFICHSERNLEVHHCFFGSANRKLSDKYGMTVPLCPDCHRGTNGVHNNYQLNLYIKRYAQLEFEKHFSYEKFMEVFGKNYRD